MNRSALALMLVPVAALAASCSNYRDSGGESNPSAYLDDQASRTISDFRGADTTMGRFFDQAYAYAVFPKITKGGAGIGAANGEGVVYQGARVVGYATVTQVTVGAQLGGQTFSEIVFFQDATSFNNFKAGQTEFSANASAVAAKSGAGAANDYAGGVAVFTIPRAGLMAEATIGGQKFRFRPAF